MATELGKAYVQIIPSAKGISGAIQGAIGGEAEAAGKSAGSSLVSNLMSVVTKAIATAGIGKLFVSTLMEGANLQQSLGGIETLFKGSADKVKAYANQAYKTSGLSANAYMENVTSFSASLLQSLGGDTDKAADIANMAMVDMSDNANKMGTDMGRIQDAYQGFAKQNYTMLDNLKLGYGGTKTEMERLLADAQKLTGVKYNIDNLSDVYEAIHAIQDSLDITGTTAKEAAVTFSGSFASMKAAAQNVLGKLALGEDIGPSLQALAESTSTFLLDNFIPMIKNILKGLPIIIGSLFKQGLAKMFGDNKQAADAFQASIVAIGIAFASWKIASILSSLGGLVGLFSTVSGAVIGFAGTITAALSSIPLVGWIAAAVAGLVWFFSQTETGKKMWSKFIEWAKTAWEGFKEFFANFLQGISEGAANLWRGVVDAWTSAVEMAKSLCQGIADFFSDLWNGIQTGAAIAWTKVTQAIISVIQPFVDTFMRYWAAMSDGISQMWDGIKMFFQGAWEFIKSIFMGAVLLILDLVTGNFEQLGTDLSLIWESIKSAISMVWEGIKTYFSGVVEAIVSFGKQYFEDFKNRLSTIWDSVKTAAQDAWKWIKSAVSNLITDLVEQARITWDNFKNFLSNLWESIKSGAINAWENLKQGVQNTIDNLVSGAQRAWENLKQGVSDLISNITNIFNSLKNIDLFGAGKAILEGFLDGLKSMWKSVTNFVGGIADWIRKNKGPIEYDRKLLIPAGSAIMEGLGESMQERFKKVKAIVRGMAPSLAQTFESDSFDVGVSKDIQQNLTAAPFEQTTAENNGMFAVLEYLSRLEQLLVALLDKDSNTYLDGEELSKDSYERHALMMLREGI